MSVGQLKGNQKTQNGNGVYHTLQGNVPDQWQVVPLEEVLDEIIGGGTPSKANPEYWVGSIPWLTVKDMRTRRPEDAVDHISKDAVQDSATNIIPAGTVIIATRIGLGKVIRVPYDAAINQDLKALVAKPELEKGYLEYWIISIAKYRESIGSGTTVKGIRLEQLRSLPFPLAPLNEQRRIVAEIEKQFSRLDEAVANLKRVKANLKRYKASVLKSAVEGKLTDEWRKQHPNVEPASKLLERILKERRGKWTGKGKYKEPVEPDTNNLGSMPFSWTWAALEQLCPRFVDSPHRTPRYGQTGLPALGPRDVVGGRLNLVDARLVDETEYATQTERHVPEAGDIVYSRELSLGWGAILQPGVRVCLSQGMCLFRPHEAVDPRYFLIVLNGPHGRHQAELAASGSAHPHVNLSDIKKFSIPLPPSSEQNTIVAEVERRLSVIEELEAAVEANLTRADRLRQSVLSRAFEGKLVPQSPSDEPASVLLSRLSGASALKESLQPKGTRKPGGTTMPKPKVEHSGEIGRMNTKSLYQVLRDSEKRLSPEQLFANAGFAPELIDEFYEELKRETQAGRILQERPNNTAIYLKAISNANR